MMLDSTQDSRRLAVEVTGDGTPVVLLHGLTFDRHTWRPIVERLAGRVRTLAFDLPNHGDSGDGPTRFEPLAAALHAQLAKLQIERPVVVGHSMSGGLALAYAALHDARGVVMVDNSTWIRPFAELLHQLGPSLRDQRFHDVFLRVFQPSFGLEHLQQDQRELVLSHQRIRQDVVLAYWHEAMSTEPATLQDKIDEMASAVRAPVLALLGRESAPEERDRFARLSTAQFEAWVARGHFLHLADPDRFTERLLAFVGSCDGSGRLTSDSAQSKG